MTNLYIIIPVIITLILSIGVIAMAFYMGKDDGND